MKQSLIVLFFILVLLFVVIGLKTEVDPDEVINEENANTPIHYRS